VDRLFAVHGLSNASFYELSSNIKGVQKSGAIVIGGRSREDFGVMKTEVLIVKNIIACRSAAKLRTSSGRRRGSLRLCG
jgi:hypothetical protein